MNTISTLIVFHAHPDDEAIFTGAAIRRAVDRGYRVVLVTATAGEAGESRIALPPGETLRQRRIAELERACELLGVSRLVMLGYRDSGADTATYQHGTLGAARVADVARRLARVVEDEQASALVHYDQGGIYGHIDHVQVHRAGRRVAARAGITGYEATVDREALSRGPYHVVQHAAGGSAAIGVVPAEVSLSIRATTGELLAKMAAMSVHTSQVAPRWLHPLEFAQAYGREWFVRRGEPGALDEVAGTDQPAARQQPRSGTPGPRRVALAAGASRA